MYNLLCAYLDEHQYQEKVVSVGIFTIRIWRVVLNGDSQDTLCKFKLFLEPEKKIFIPEIMIDSVFLSSSNDRLCVSTTKNIIFILVFDMLEQCIIKNPPHQKNVSTVLTY